MVKTDRSLWNNQAGYLLSGKLSLLRKTLGGVSIHFEESKERLPHNDITA